MSTASVTAPALLTAEEYARRADPGHPEELVRGRIVPMPQPNRRHGQICAQSVYLLRRYLEDHDLGHVVSHDAGVITERDPIRSVDRTSPSTATTAPPRDLSRRIMARKSPSWSSRF